MRIIIAEHFGMCFGVRDAIAEAERLAAEGPLTILGELVHNPVVRERLRARGIREAETGALSESSARAMITAHGVSDRQRTEWQERGVEIADGTCPLVRNAHTQLRLLVEKGYTPVVIGKRGHVEVEGLIGDFPGAIVLENAAEAEGVPVQERFGVISQTTQPIEFVRVVVAALQRRQPAAEVRFVDTVCKPTKDRQLALQALISKCDAIVVVGGRGSNNTRQLVERCTAAGRKAFHVERADDLVAEDFREVETVGVTAGTSTLRETVEAVIERLRDFSSMKPTPTNLK